MYIITCLINSSPTEIIVADHNSLLTIANFFEINKVVFKVNSSSGVLTPEMFGWAPLHTWEYWLEQLFQKSNNKGG